MVLVVGEERKRIAMVTNREVWMSNTADNKACERQDVESWDGKEEQARLGVTERINWGWKTGRVRVLFRAD